MMLHVCYHGDFFTAEENPTSLATNRVEARLGTTWVELTVHYAFHGLYQTDQHVHFHGVTLLYKFCSYSKCLSYHCPFIMFWDDMVLGMTWSWCLPPAPGKKSLQLLPWNLTWNLKMEVWKMIFLFKWVLFRFHVEFQGCKQHIKTRNI